MKFLISENRLKNILQASLDDAVLYLKKLSDDLGSDIYDMDDESYGYIGFRVMEDIQVINKIKIVGDEPKMSGGNLNKSVTIYVDVYYSPVHFANVDLKDLFETLEIRMTRQLGFQVFIKKNSIKV